MRRYRCWPCLGLLLLAGGCAVPTPRDNADAAASLVEGRVPAAMTWRRDPEADREAREQAEQLLQDGLTLNEAIGVAFLTSPVLQLGFEQLEISRAELVGATRPANPLVIIGARKPSGDLAAFYPDRTISMGVLQNVISLLTIPDRRAHAMHNVERVRHEVAQQAAVHAAQVAEAWYRYSAARQQLALFERSLNIMRTAVDILAVDAANGDLAAEESLPANRNNLWNVEGEVDRARLEVAAERIELASLMGIAGWRDDWEITGELPPLPGSDPDPAAAEAAAMDSRLDLIAASKEVEMRLRQLAMQRRFRWLSELEIGVFRDKALGGTPFTGPNAAFEVPLFDQRQQAVLEADAGLRSAMRQLEAIALEVRRQVRLHAEELATMRRLVERHERDILPSHERMAALLGAGDPGDIQRLSRRLDLLDAQRGHLRALRDYWLARSALAQAAGQWLALGGGG